MEKGRKPHAIIIPFPHKVHIYTMSKMAKILHGRGFHITFVNTEFWHKEFCAGSNSNYNNNWPGFNFKAIASTDFDVLNCDILLSDLKSKLLPPFHDLVKKLIDQSDDGDGDGDGGAVPPPVTCMVSDTTMLCSLDVAKEFNIPLLLLYVSTASSLVTYPHIPTLFQNGVLPLKDEKGYSDTVIEGISGIHGTMRLKHLPRFFQIEDPDGVMYRFFMETFEKSRDKNLSVGLILNTFEELEPEALQQLSSIFPQQVFPIGPLHQLVDEIPIPNEDEEDLGFLSWLDSKPPESVILVRLGKIVVLKPERLEEFAWGLAKSQENFLWVIRSNLEIGDRKISIDTTTKAPWSQEFKSEIEDRGLIISSWCPQGRVLRHPAIGGHLTHCGWSSLLQSVTAGVPLLCYRPTTCWLCCNRWGNGKEIGNDAEREEIARLVKELINGKENGNQLKEKAMIWKKKAEEACRAPNGSSFRNLQKMVDLLLSFTR